MTHSYVWHEAFICVMWLRYKLRSLHKCDVTHSCMWRDSFICVTWPLHMCDVTHLYMWRDSLICVTWPVHMCDVTHSYIRDANRSYVWRDAFIRATWLIHMCDVTHFSFAAESKHSRCKSKDSHVWRDALICVTWLTGLVHMCDVTHFYVRRIDAFAMQVKGFVCVMWLIHVCDVARVTCIFVTRLVYMWPETQERSTCNASKKIHMCYVTHFYVSRYEAFATQVRGFICVTWLIHMCDVTHVTCSYVWRESFLREQNWSLPDASGRASRWPHLDQKYTPHLAPHTRTRCTTGLNLEA